MADRDWYVGGHSGTEIIDEHGVIASCYSSPRIARMMACSFEMMKLLDAAADFISKKSGFEFHKEWNRIQKYIASGAD